MIRPRPTAFDVPSIRVLGGPGGPFTIIFKRARRHAGLDAAKRDIGNTTIENGHGGRQFDRRHGRKCQSPVVAVQADAEVTPPVNTEVQRMLITGTPANEIQRITRDRQCGAVVFSFNGVSGPRST